VSDSAGARRGIRTPDRLIKRLQLAPEQAGPREPGLYSDSSPGAALSPSQPAADILSDILFNVPAAKVGCRRAGDGTLCGLPCYRADRE